MGDPAPPMESVIVAGPRLTESSLQTLPIEMLDTIFQLVDNLDLINLRLVSKSIRNIANRPFAIRNFANSNHVITQDSIETLLAISAHDIFGAYIQKLTFCPVRVILEYSYPYHEDNDGTLVDDSFVETGRFSNLMQQILTNIKRHSDSITISIYEDYRLGDGPRDNSYVGLHTLRYHGEKALCATKFGTAYRTLETLELVVAEVRAAGINIKGLELNSKHRNPGRGTKLETYKAVAKFLKSCNSTPDLVTTWESNGMLEYTHLQKRLCFSHSSLLWSPPSRDPDILLLKEIVRWLIATSFSHLHLRDLDVGCLMYLDEYFIKSLQTITLDDIKLGSIRFDQGLYSHLFQRLSGFQSLKHCRFHRLHYDLSLDGSSETQLVSGSYPSKWPSLLLIFADGKFEIEVQGADISKRLQDTTAAERKKVQEIEAAGELVDHRVIGADAPIFEEDDPDYPLSCRSRAVIT